MVNTTHTQVTTADSAPDYARYDKIWQRVAPTLDPYPQARAAAAAQPIPNTAPAASQTQSAEQSVPVVQAQSAAQTAPAMQTQSADTTAAELLLPGAEANPCCMGSAAMDMIEVIEGFAREESADAMTYFQIARYAPTRAASMALRELGRGAQRRARELSAADYLITGEQKALGSAGVAMPRLPYRDLLRERYHAAACNALNFARAEEGTTDPCLQRIFAQFSEENYAASSRILRLLSQVQ